MIETLSGMPLSWWIADDARALLTVGIAALTALIAFLLVAHRQSARAADGTALGLRESEIRLRHIEEHAPMGIAVMSLAGSFTRVNPALCALTGYPAAELLAMDFAGLTHRDDLAEARANMERLIAGGAAKCQMEKRYVRSDGTIVWVSLSTSVVRDESGEAQSFIAQMVDISDRRAAQGDLKVAEVRALAAAESKSRFLATMGHEIRTPMNAIIGMTELLSFSDLSDEQLQYVNVVQESGRLLLRVIDDILDYSKIEAGVLHIAHADFDVCAQLRSIVASFEPQFAAKHVALALRLDPAIPPALTSDARRLRQILINLIANALKFTGRGGSVVVAVTREADTGERVVLCFTVADTGVGIATDQLPRLFLPFSQIDDSATRRYGGTGLGLTICRQLVEHLGGTIGVTSRLACGSTFWFGMPFDAAADPSAPRATDAALPLARRATRTPTSRAGNSSDSVSRSPR